jgi:hypothetical protein
MISVAAAITIPCPTELPRSGGLIPSVLAHRDASKSATVSA